MVPRTDAKASPVMVGFSIPKKKFRSSVDRHRVRRLLAEAWRLNKHQLYETIPADKQIHLFFVFTDNKMPEYETAKSCTVKGIERLINIAAPTNQKDEKAAQ